MAINTQKLLPQAKSTAIEKFVPSVKGPFNIKQKFISVDKFLKNTYTMKKKEEDKKKKTKKTKEREETEKKLETPKGIKGIEKIKSMIPKTGILDAVQNFATFTFLGFLFTKFAGDLPKLIGIVSKITPITNTAEKIIGGIFEGIVGFIDNGYKAYDQMRSLSKDIGGTKVQKTYDDFTKNFNYITNAILTLGLSTLVPQKTNGGMVSGYASGGSVTRGGKRVGGAIGRTMRSQPTVKKPQQKIQPQKTQPGKDAGGKKQIEKLYGKDPLGSDLQKPSAYRALTGSAKILKDGGIAGALMGAGIDIALGQMPDPMIYGLIGEMTGVRGQTFGNMILKSKVTEAIQNVRKELNKTPSVLSGPSFLSDVTGDIPTFLGAGGGDFSGKASNIPSEGKALLDAIAGAEAGGYDVMFGGSKFKSYSKHPEKLISSGGYTSDAAGRYQFLSTTWNPIARRLKLKDFSPENQDRAAWDLAIRAYGQGEKGLVDALKKDPLKVANKLNGTWPSLPGGSQTNVHTKGFLKRFKSATSKYNIKSKVGEVISGTIGKLGKLKEYLTGDPNNKNYDSSHGTVENYHDHFAFNDRETAEKAYKYLISKGYKITEFDGYGSGVTGPHSGSGSLHHRGLAFDVPGSQWKGSGPIGKKEYSGSERVRQDLQKFLSSSDTVKKGKEVSKPKAKAKPKANWWDNLNPFNQKSKPSVEPGTAAMQGGGIVGSQNRKNYSSLSSYPSYADGGGMMVAVQPIIVEKSVPMPMGGNKTIMFPVPVGVNNSNIASLSRG